MTNTDSILEQIQGMEWLPEDEKIERINEIKIALHQISPFKSEPVDCVIWAKSEDVVSNDYNPNKVAPPEMELLEISILNDWYTQPIVTYPHDDKYEIVDWFHRSRVGKESKVVGQRIKGYLPVVWIKSEKQGKNERIASTIRHNRARGKHQVDAMSEIVLELKNRNWKNSRIAKELGMDEEEILRLCQITWLQDLFKDEDFSRSWDSEWSMEDYEPLSDEIESELEYRTTNTSDENRIFHTWDKWECHKAWFFGNRPEWMSIDEAKEQYKIVLSDTELFSKTLEKVITEWKHSCEHNLTNNSNNKIAWMWQCAVVLAKWVPSKYCSGWQLLSDEEQKQANEIALEYINKWMVANGRDTLDMEMALGGSERQVNIY